MIDMVDRQPDMFLMLYHFYLLWVGNKRTQPEVVEDELQDAYRANTVEGVHRALLRATARLEGLGIFDSLDMKMKETVSAMTR